MLDSFGAAGQAMKAGLGLQCGQVCPRQRYETPKNF